MNFLGRTHEPFAGVAHELQEGLLRVGVNCFQQTLEFLLDVRRIDSSWKQLGVFFRLLQMQHYPEPI